MPRPIALEIIPANVVDILGMTMDEAEIAAFFDRFVRHARATNTQIEAAYASGDVAQLARHAHALIGSAAMLGLVEIAQIARELEANADDLIVRDLSNDLSNAVAELEDVLGDAD